MESIESVGKPFDPMVHEALEEVTVDDKMRDGIVVAELQKGYTMQGRVLRPAKVTVGIYTLTQ